MEANLLTNFYLYAFNTLLTHQSLLAEFSAVIKQRMEKDVDEVGQITRSVKSKIEELDREVRSSAIAYPLE